MALKKKVVAIGGTSKGIILSKETQQQLGLTGGNDVVVMEFVGDTLLVRRDDAALPDPTRLLIALTAIGNPLEIEDAEALTEPTQRLLLALRAYGPVTAGEAADRLGISKRAAEKALAKGIERGHVTEISGAEPRFELAD